MCLLLSQEEEVTKLSGGKMLQALPGSHVPHGFIPRGTGQDRIAIKGRGFGGNLATFNFQVPALTGV